MPKSRNTGGAGGPAAVQAPPQAVQQQRLRPVYIALDNHNFTKALKLTTAEPACHWDLTRALRIIALDRSGRKREALGLLRDVLGHDCYDELEDRLMQMDVGLPQAPTSAGGARAGGAGAGSSASSGGGKSKAGKKSKGKKGGNVTPSYSSSSLPSSSSAGTESNAAHPRVVDYVDLLDVPPWKRRMLRQKKKKSESSLKNGSNEANVIVDDVVLATLKVTLLASRLNETLAQLFARAADALSTSIVKADTSKEEFFSILQENYFAHIRLACTYPRVAHKLGAISHSDVTLKHVWEAQEIATAYESAQLAAMALARQTGSRLHQSWVANAALLHHEANDDAVKLMEARLSASSSEANCREIRATVDKLKAKNAMLPRLAESLMSRVVSRGGEDGDKTATEHPPSAEDWNLYLQALMEQDKCADALDKLKAIQCASGDDSMSSATPGRRIDDERDVASHDGSLIQLAHREKLEKKASLEMKLQHFDEAMGTYTDLIALLPDNWSYWTGFLRASVTASEGETEAGAGADASLESGISMCRQVVKPYVSTNSLSPPLRGSHLLLVELAAIHLRGIDHSDRLSENDEKLNLRHNTSNFLSLDSSQRETLLHDLGKSIIEYGKVFSPRASCCFYDLRKYIDLFATVCHQLRDEASGCWGELVRVMDWAKMLRDENCFQAGITDAKVRRRRLRSYISSIQIMFGIVSVLQKCDEATGTTNAEDSAGSGAESFASYVPTIDEMVDEWQKSLDLGSNPKDGGQKEVLPGDELILLACQLENGNSMACSSSKKTSLITSAALLEGALHHSPYNPHLMIAAIGVYDRLSAGLRSLELWEGMGVKQIQYDSCSYLIFPTLIRTGLYREAVQLAGNIMSLHWSSAKDIQDYATKCLETGVLSRCREMITWQRQRMTLSLSLLAAKSTVMDLASLVYSGEPDERGKGGNAEPLGASQGICGGEHDFDRTSEMIQNIGNFSAAPSVVNIAMDEIGGNSSIPSLYSDNRDVTVNQFHILSEASYSCRTNMCVYASTQACIQGILMRAALLMNVVKAPKKGKAPKVKEDDVLYKRCKSLSEFIRTVELFLETMPTTTDTTTTSSSSTAQTIDDGRGARGRTILNLARVLCVVATGMSDKNEAQEDCLDERERSASKLLQDVQPGIGLLRQTLLSASPGSFGLVCVLLPEAIVPIYALLQMIATQFSIFGWGKSKGRTKVGAGALARVAQELADLVMDMLGSFVSIPTDAPIDKSPVGNDCTYFKSKEGKAMLDAASKHVEKSHIETRNRVFPFLHQIRQECQSFLRS